ncbi:Ferredoxin--NADP reductase [Frankliniella fusca]|uniref:Ferredoxin--NADP reductase n=1 Tax=Frankliniella fusca TaxID=407009 RepID=A0AAE1HEN3_9NEOP|nr:Ferredoxin--NADP reductase [Frankliniella fusca]
MGHLWCLLGGKRVGGKWQIGLTGHTSRSALEWSGKQAVVVEDMRLGVACRGPRHGRAPTGRVLNLLEIADKTIGTPMEYTGRQKVTLL